MFGEQRGQALWRILAFFYGATITTLLTAVVTVVGLIWGIIDILWQLVTNRNDLGETSTPARVVEGVLMWNVRLLVYSLTGAGRFEWLPTW